MSAILILGAGSDIALALAHRYGREGHGLILAGRNPAKLEHEAGLLREKYGIDASAVPFDALAFETHRTFYDALPVRPDAVVCAFGYLGHKEKAEQDSNEARKIMDTNYTGAVSILNIIASDFERRKSGVIVGISSVAGERGRQSNYMYGSAKAAFTAYLSGLRNRLVRAGVHVVTVKPGFVRTKMTAGLDLPARLTATPEQVAVAIYRAHVKRKNVIYYLGVWRYIMMVIRNIPEPVFKRMKL